MSLYAGVGFQARFRVYGVSFLLILVACAQFFLAHMAENVQLVLLCGALAFDACVVGLGGFVSSCRLTLEYLGRLRFFINALVWPLFLSFAFKVCNCLLHHRRGTNAIR